MGSRTVRENFRIVAQVPRPDFLERFPDVLRENWECEAKDLLAHVVASVPDVDFGIRFDEIEICEFCLTPVDPENEMPCCDASEIE